MTKTPVLLLIFNRPDFTEKIFSAIREARPSQLFVAADGPRSDKPGEEKKCEEARNIILNGVDWECEVKTLLRDENLGCGRAPAGAITWFFEHVEQGIILEDDCLPEQSFFRFCDELLEKYKNDERVFAISGSNLLGEYRPDLSYFFSVFGGNWGWASWRRAWKGFDFDISSWKDQKSKAKIRGHLQNEKYYTHFAKVFDELCENPVDDIWDYQWLFTRFINNGVSIIPSYNQIRNIGFGENATHTFDPNSEVSKLNTKCLDFPLNDINDVTVDKIFDNELFYQYININRTVDPSFYEKVKNKIKSLIFPK